MPEQDKNTILINKKNEENKDIEGDNSETEVKEEKGSGLSANFKTLSPTKEADITNYEEALDFVFSNDEIKNIAIAGAYCSGKSSIVETYEEKKKNEFKLLHISLAHFCAINQSSKGKTNDETTENNNSSKNNINIKKRSTIEGKILNQLIQQISSDRIKQSKFKIKTDFEWERALGFSVLLCVSTILLVHLFKFHTWESFYTNNIKIEAIKALLYGYSLPESRILSAFLLLIIFGYITFKLIYAQYTNSFIRKISFQGNKIEIGNESKSSFFDKYLNEVLYIFEKADAKAIVFEDIDRFNDIALFEQLREINTLVNIRKRKNNEEPLRFIYMMRDDLFDNFKERTKFFDFIIPVIPVLDGSNSYSVLKDYLEKDKLIDSFDDHFLREISLYIDDCRILKNINNELLLYNEKLKTSKLDLNRLLAILTYKNIFPKDYDELRFNRGCVYSFFASENKIKEDLRIRLIDAENNLINKIETNNEEYQSKLKGLKKTIKYLTENKELNDDLGIREEYDDKESKTRCELRTSEKNYIDQLEKTRQECIELDNMTLTELLSRYSDIVFEPNYLKSFVHNSREIVNSPYFGLLRFLLTSGYIEASYSAYMTYHYENGMSINDNYFMRSVIERNRLEYGYIIDDPELLIESLKPIYFAQPTTLNYILYDQIFKEHKLIQIQHAMSLFGASKRIAYVDFIEGYVLVGEKAGDFVKTLVETWPDIFDYVFTRFSDEALEKICFLILKYCDNNKIFEMSEGQSKLRDYISSTPKLLSSGIYSKKLNDLLIGLNIKFKSLENIDSEKIEFLYNNNLYEINESNIYYLLKTMCKVEIPSSIYSVFFTFVFANAKQYPLCKLIVHDLDKVFQVYYEMYHGEINDSSETACNMINRLDKKLAPLYINQLNTKINNIDLIQNLGYIPSLAKRNCVEYNENNIITWFNEAHRITRAIVEFVDSSDEIIYYDKDNPAIRIFLVALLGNEQLSKDKYCQIIRSLGDSVISIIGSSHPSENRMRMLIESDAFILSEDATNLIKNSYPKLLETYINKNIDNYFPANSSELDLHDLKLALCSKQISDQKKIDLLDKYDIPIPLDGRNFTDDLTKHVLENGLYPDDVVCFAQSYSDLPDQLKASVDSLLVMDSKQIYKIDKNIDRELMLTLLSNDRLSFSSRVRFLSVHLDNIEKAELIEILTALGAYEIVDHIFNDGKSVNVNESNRVILRLLWEKHIIKYPYKTASGKKYKKIEYIDRAVRPRIPLHNHYSISEK